MTDLHKQIQEALKERDNARTRWHMSDERYEESAWHSYRAAELRLDALLSEARELDKTKPYKVHVYKREAMNG